MDTNPTILATKPSLHDNLPPDLAAIAKGPEFGGRLVHTFRALTKLGPEMPRDPRLHMSTPAGNDYWLAVVTTQEHRERDREAMSESRPGGLLVTVSIPVPSGLHTNALVELLAVVAPAAHPAAQLVMGVGRTLFGVLGVTSSPSQRDELCIHVTAVGSEQLATWELLDMQPGTADG